MEALASSSYFQVMTSNQTTLPTGPTTPAAKHRPDRQMVIKAMAKRSYGVIATVSPAGHPHAAGVIYQAVGTTLYTSTIAHSRKARNLAANPKLAVTIPIRRLPVGPPSAIQFQGTATILSCDDPELRSLVAAGKLDQITGHGELDLVDGCFLRIEPGRRLHTFGLGMSLLSLIGDPLNAGGVVDLAN